MDKSNYVVVHKALSSLGIKLLELMKRARAAKQPERNSLLTEQAAERDYERYKETHEFPNYVLEFSLDATGYRALETIKNPHDNVRNLHARKKGVVDINARRPSAGPKKK